MNRTVHSVTKHTIEKMFFQCYIYLTEINYNVVPVPYRYRFVDPHNFDTVPYLLIDPFYFLIEIF